MRVIVCGGRDFDDRDSAFAALDRIHAETPITVVVHGGARGGDTMAGEWAAARSVSVEVFAADWQRHRRAAGPMRNQQMADSGADLCVAFPGGKGTADMMRRARAARIRVIEPLTS
jgi:hypothetical protein